MSTLRANDTDDDADVNYRYAEMPSEQKNKISHRYKALDKLRTFLQEQTA